MRLALVRGGVLICAAVANGKKRREFPYQGSAL
jgi:hypothetical protein